MFDAFWQLALREYHDLVGFDWLWQSVDGTMTKAPLGQENTGPNPTDRAKKGTKRSIVTDGNGIPVGLAVAGANVHDSQLLRATVANCLERVPRLKGKCTEHLCMDKAYDSRAIRQMLQQSLAIRLISGREWKSGFQKAIVKVSSASLGSRTHSQLAQQIQRNTHPLGKESSQLSRELTTGVRLLYP